LGSATFWHPAEVVSGAAAVDVVAGVVFFFDDESPPHPLATRAATKARRRNGRAMARENTGAPD
jgi:hypothetical protein